MLVGSAATATGIVASVVVLVSGIALGAWSLRRIGGNPTGAPARAILDERLARGSISLEEYGQRICAAARSYQASDVRPGYRTRSTIGWSRSWRASFWAFAWARS